MCLDDAPQPITREIPPIHPFKHAYDFRIPDYYLNPDQLHVEGETTEARPVRKRVLKHTNFTSNLDHWPCLRLLAFHSWLLDPSHSLH